MSETLEKLMKDIHDRLTALGENVSEERIKSIITSHLDQLVEDEQFVRKIRFGKSGIEPKMLGSKFARWDLGVADIEFLYDVLQAGQRAGMSNGPSDELRNTFQALSAGYYLSDEEIREIDKRALDDLFPRVPVSWFPVADRRIAASGKWWQTGAYQEAVRAMDSAESGYGSQLIGAQYVRDLWAGARAESRIFSLLDTFEMTDPTAYVPVDADLPELLWVAEATSATASDYATTKTGSNRATVSAKLFMLHQIWSGTLEEDSIIPFIPYLRRQAMLSMAHYSDSLMLNGDTTNAGTGNINLDDADPADTKHYLALDGMRHAFIVDNTNNAVNHGGFSLSYDEIANLRKLMIDGTYLMDWGHPTSPGDLVFIADPATGDEAALLDEVITVDKFGPNATVLTGQIGRIGQHPFISSMAMSKTEADGKVSTTGSNNVLGQIAAVNVRGYKVGWRRRVKIETERLPGRDQTRLVYSMRMGLGRFSPTGAASGIEHTAGLYNISVA